MILETNGCENTKFYSSWTDYFLQDFSRFGEEGTARNVEGDGWCEGWKR